MPSDILFNRLSPIHSLRFIKEEDKALLVEIDGTNYARWQQYKLNTDEILRLINFLNQIVEDKNNG